MSADDAETMRRNMGNDTFRDFIGEQMALIRELALATATLWTANMGFPAGTFCNSWTRWSPDYRDIIITHTFRDADAATLFKLGEC